MTQAPDYISPMIGYRIWQWDVAGLRSLNGEFWPPGKPLEARCRFYGIPGHSRVAHDPNIAPHMKCTCGIYAHKHRERLTGCGYHKAPICGQAMLWGTLVEHQHGWRAQYAYPKYFLLPAEVLPVTIARIQARLRPLTTYGCEIFILDGNTRLLLWEKDAGLAAAGLEFLMIRASNWYTQRTQEAMIKQGDRVAVIGRGTAVVGTVDSRWLSMTLANKRIVRIERRHVLWSRQNVRWETDTNVCSEWTEVAKL